MRLLFEFFFVIFSAWNDIPIVQSHTGVIISLFGCQAQAQEVSA